MLDLHRLHHDVCFDNECIFTNEIIGMDGFQRRVVRDVSHMCDHRVVVGEEDDWHDLFEAIQITHKATNGNAAFVVAILLGEIDWLHSITILAKKDRALFHVEVHLGIKTTIREIRGELMRLKEGTPREQGNGARHTPFRSLPIIFGDVMYGHLTSMF